ncbi:MAG: hypothetical protein HN426_05715 [Nitrospina sp.]|nr:hypothetical protein [Nitrospina sp.]
MTIVGFFGCHPEPVEGSRGYAKLSPYGSTMPNMALMISTVATDRVSDIR